MKGRRLSYKLLLLRQTTSKVLPGKATLVYTYVLQSRQVDLGIPYFKLHVRVDYIRDLVQRDDYETEFEKRDGPLFRSAPPGIGFRMFNPFGWKLFDLSYGCGNKLEQDYSGDL
jgi:hypothetical protein